MFSRFTDRRIIAAQARFAAVPSGALPGPDSVAGLLLWLKADAILGLNDGDNVTSWVSSEGNAYNFTKPAYVSGFPTYQAGVLNGLPVVRHVGAGSVNKRLNFPHSLAAGHNLSPTSPTMFAVMAWKTATAGLFRRGPGIRQSATIGFGAVRNNGGVAGEYTTALCGINGVSTYVGAHGTGVPEPAGEANGVFFVAEIARVTGSGWGFWVNGVQIGGFSTDLNLTVNADGTPFSTSTFFDTGIAITDGLTREDHDLAEVSLHDHALTALERAQIRASYGQKYAIAVS